jgi:hypothetical protein
MDSQSGFERAFGGDGGDLQAQETWVPLFCRLSDRHLYHERVKGVGFLLFYIVQSEISR